MSTAKTLALSAAASLALGACVVQPTPYQPAAKVGADGYATSKIEEGKYRVSFKGNTRTDLATIENYILLRAAELTVADGYGHFFVLDGNDTSNSVFRSTGFNNGFGGFGGFGFRRGFAGGGFGTTTSTTRQRQEYNIDVLVQAFPGEKPEESMQAFNAQSVIENLSPVVARPSA